MSPVEKDNHALEMLIRSQYSCVPSSCGHAGSIDGESLCMVEHAHNPGSSKNRGGLRDRAMRGLRARV